MASEPAPRGLRLAGDGDDTVVQDVSCGTCASCVAARDYWCLTPVADGTALGTLALDPSTTSWVRRWITVLCALVDAEIGADDTVLLLTPHPSEEALALLGIVHAGRVLATDGADDDSRRILRGVSSTGRAQVVVTLHDGRSAVRAVQRGGTVCLPDDDVDLPTVTELVQRDVRLLGPSTLAPLSRREAWPRIMAGLESLRQVEPEQQEASR